MCYQRVSKYHNNVGYSVFTMFVLLPQLWLLILCRSKDLLQVCNNILSGAPKCSALSRQLGYRKKPKTNILEREKEEGDRSCREKKEEEVGENTREEEINRK